AMATATPPRRPTPPMQSDTSSFLLRHDGPADREFIANSWTLAPQWALRRPIPTAHRVARILSHRIKHGCSAISENSGISAPYDLRHRRPSRKLFAIPHISERYAGLAGARLLSHACGWRPIS